MEGPDPGRERSGAWDFDRVYALAAPRLRSYCRLLAGTESEAQDLFQEAWSRALASRPGFGEGLSPGAWLASIARNLWIDRCRRRRAERRALGEAARSGRAEAEPSPEEGVLLREALQSLGEEEREAVSLYHLQGLSLREAAGVLGVTTWALRERLARAREGLARHWGIRG